MTWLLLTIICSTLIFVVFKLFNRFGIDRMQAIVVNYLTAALMAWALNSQQVDYSQLPEKSWLLFPLLTGLLFITVFNLMAFTTQSLGVSITSVISKMSVVIPVMVALVIYGDSMNVIKGGGILLALAAVFLTTMKEEKKSHHLKFSWRTLLLPAALFIGTGTVDAVIKYTQQLHIAPADYDLYTSSLFASAASAGMLILVVRYFVREKRFAARSILAGIALGIPNYFSIFFLLKTLEIPHYESSVIFPVINVGIVALSALVGFFAFREKLNRANKMGIALSLVAIIIISSA